MQGRDLHNLFLGERKRCYERNLSTTEGRSPDIQLKTSTREPLTSHRLLILTVSPTHPLDVRDMAYDSVEYEKLLQTDEQLEEEVGVPASRREGMPFLTHGSFSNA